jgi:hypothetical protein
MVQMEPIIGAAVAVALTALVEQMLAVMAVKVL